MRQDRHRLCTPVAGDDVRLPSVRVHRRARLPLQRREPAEVGAVAVRDRDPLDVGRLAPELRERLEHQPPVVLEQRVDERELAPVVDQERVHVAALAVAERVDAGSELGHDVARCHGAKGFSTPLSAGSSAGKCRRSSVRMLLPSTQSSPSRVYTSGR